MLLIGGVNYSNVIKEIEKYTKKHFNLGEYNTRIAQARITKFVYNAEKEEERKYLFNLLEKMKWINRKQVLDYIYEQIKKIDGKFLIYNHKLDENSSSTFCTTNLSEYLSDNTIINEQKVKNKKRKTDSLIFIDDYIGTGNTILNAINDIKDKVVYKKIIVISYLCQKRAIDRFNQSKIELRYCEESESYINLLDIKSIDYINSICDKCTIVDDHSELMCFGYKNTGAIVALNETAPNNDISLIWDRINVSSTKVWIPLLDRNIGFIGLHDRYNNLIKNNQINLRKYFSQTPFELSYNEFVFLIYSFGIYCTAEEVINNQFFESKKEYIKFLKRMNKKNYIEYKKGYFFIKDPLLFKYINDIGNKLYKTKQYYKIEANNSFVS